MLKKASKEENQRNFIEAKKGNKANVQIIIDSYQYLILKNYKKFFGEKSMVNREDYVQECNLKIIYCINEANNENYGQFNILIRKSLKNVTIDFQNKNRKFHYSNTLYGDKMDIYGGEKEIEFTKFEDEIIDKIAVEHIYNTFIKDELTEKEKSVFYSYILGENMEQYAFKNGIKVSSAKKTIRRAMYKLRSIKKLKNLQHILLILFIFLNNFIGLLDCSF